MADLMATSVMCTLPFVDARTVRMEGRKKKRKKEKELGRTQHWNVKATCESLSAPPALLHCLQVCFIAPVRHRRPGEGENYNVQRKEADMVVNSTAVLSNWLSTVVPWGCQVRCIQSEVYTFKYATWQQRAPRATLFWSIHLSSDVWGESKVKGRFFFLFFFFFFL